MATSMRRITCIKLLLFGLLTLALTLGSGGGPLTSNAGAKSLSSSRQVGPGAHYIIGAGDVLEISVWKEEALKRSVTVLPDGKISFPLIGDVIAAGKTIAELKKELEGRLLRYVPDLVLSVVVEGVNSMLIYVIGRVNHPGRFVLNTNVNVFQALAMAGGPNEFAKRNKIKIFRYKGEKTSIFKFRYENSDTTMFPRESTWNRTSGSKGVM
jgi:polysaccharide export outer membrane protein